MQIALELRAEHMHAIMYKMSIIAVQLQQQLECVGKFW
jgi:hypothetical protein